MTYSFSSVVVDSHRLLEYYFFDGFIDDPKRLEELLFVELHAKDPYKPDYVFKNLIEDFAKEESDSQYAETIQESRQLKSIQKLTIDSLNELSHMLEFLGDRIYVKSECFERWQNIIITVSPLLIISYLIYAQADKSFRTDVKKLVQSVFDKSAMPSIFEPQLDNIINNGGLNEMHMHLTGTTEADIAWHDALNQPTKFYNRLKESFRLSTVTEQYLQIGNIEQQDFFRLLMIAKQLRDAMMQMMYANCKTIDSFTKDGYEYGKILHYASSVHPMSNIENECFQNPWQYESLFFIDAFGHLEITQNHHFANLFHYYLLIYSFFQKILVQQKTQVGFDQFQKITLNETREYTERRDYYARYRQLQGMYGNSLHTLEGRFAPKEKIKDSIQLLKLAKKGYKKDIQQLFKLKLVAHFPKLLDTRNPKKIITFRDLPLRLSTAKKFNTLLDTMKHPDLQGLVVGFDAAANELHASPEVFAPIFRKLRFLGYSNFTYHAGEDFIHIISGLRMVYEAIEFLDMHSGNRIGHATALGIDPELWIQRLYESKLTIKKGEWLDNLIFAYELLQNSSAHYGHLGKLQGEIFKYFQQIYAYGNSINIHQIIESWKARKYDPFIALGWRKPSMFEEFDSQELKAFKDLDAVAQELYGQYHASECIMQYNTMIQIEPNKEPFGAELLRNLQNMMIDFVNSKNIALETLPTSNVRISYYKEYSEHHLWRWLGIDKKFKEGDPKPTVVVGSDDTGIFMTNLRNEYAHIFQTVKKLKDAQVALTAVDKLNTTSKAFTFRDL